MTLREQLQAKIESLKSQIGEFEGQIQAIQDHLAAGGTELDHEESALIAWAESVVAKVKALL